ncbi:MAG TPA: hypothetical protein VHI51_17540 [Ktedonobacterales bacterium]|jgi:hypothetical protein|nr:hypothetical protein [Ktedonobacterales bacterium]
MRDLHFDGDFLRDFNTASEQWDWANWHEIRATQEATARRLLAEVFGDGDEMPGAEGGVQSGE